jgi:hypothetical protein
VIYHHRKEIYSISAEPRVNFKALFKASTIVFKFSIKAVLLNEERRVQGDIGSHPSSSLTRTVKTLYQLH